jgi:lipopolysaccharide export system permease protein
VTAPMGDSSAASPPSPDAVPPPSVSRRTSGTLIRYVACQFIIPLCCCVGGFAALFLISDVFDVLRDFLEVRASLATVVTYFLLRQPVNLVNVLPMSLLLSSCFMVSMMGRHNEVTALRAAGVSVMRWCLPVWGIAILFSGLAFLLNERWATKCSVRAEELLEETTTDAKLRERGRAKLAYHNHVAHRDWYFQAFSRDGDKLGVLIKQSHPDGRSKWELRAAKASFGDGNWVFSDGSVTRFDSEGALVEGPEVHFETHSIDGLDERPADILSSMRPAEELSVRELLRVLRVNRALPVATRNASLTMLWYRLSFPTSCLIAALLGIGLSVTPERTGALKGFATAVGIMVLYYVADQFFLLLGKNGVLPPLIGGSLPNVLFLGWGCREVYARR